jgi:hypothetical protein
VAVGKDRQGWRQLLVGLARALQAQGLQEMSAAPGSAQVPPKGAIPTPGAAGVPAPSDGERAREATWRREDGVVLGGWRWIGDARPAPQLLLFLGPVPSRTQPLATRGEQAPASGELWLRVRPQGLDLLGLLPEQMPDLVRRADQLWLEAIPADRSAARDGLSRLTGRLQVRR